MVIRMRHTRAHTANRRSHHALKAVGTILCENCGHAKDKHVVCANCGQYKGKVMVDMVKKAEKKAAKAKANKDRKTAPVQ